MSTLLKPWTWEPTESIWETTSNKTLINIVLNGLPRSYEMVIQGVTYMINPTLKDVMEKLLMETHRMVVHAQKLGQEETMDVQLQCTFVSGQEDNYF